MAETEVDAIRRAMGRLPAHYRAALVLRAVEGLSYREIAQLLAVPEHGRDVDPPGEAQNARSSPARPGEPGSGPARPTGLRLVSESDLCTGRIP